MPVHLRTVTGLNNATARRCFISYLPFSRSSASRIFLPSLKQLCTRTLFIVRKIFLEKVKDDSQRFPLFVFRQSSSTFDAWGGGMKR